MGNCTYAKQLHDFAGDVMETLLTVEELAVKLKLAEQTIRRYVLKHNIPFRKIGKAVRFRPSEIDQWINNSGMDDNIDGKVDSDK